MDIGKVLDNAPIHGKFGMEYLFGSRYEKRFTHPFLHVGIQPQYESRAAWSTLERESGVLIQELLWLATLPAPLLRAMVFSIGLMLLQASLAAPDA